MIRKTYSVIKNQCCASRIDHAQAGHQRSVFHFLTLITTAILLLFCSALFAKEQSKADSLQAELRKELHDTTRINTLNDLGWELMYQNPDTAILLGNQALELAAVIASNAFSAGRSNLFYIAAQKGLANTYSNIGVVYRNQGNYPNALKHYHEALEIATEIGDKNRIAIWLSNIGSLYTTTGMFKDAELYLDSALAISNSIGALSLQKDHHQYLSHLYDTMGQLAVVPPTLSFGGQSSGSRQAEYYQKAFAHYKKYSAAKDSLFNEEKSKEIGRLEQKHEYEMAEIARKQKEEIVAAALAAALNRRNLLQYFAILIGIILFLGLIFLFVRLNVPTWLVELSVFTLFLLVFEFTLVLLDPTIDAWTGGAPAWKLMVNAVLAGLIYPVHNWCEGVMKRKIMER